MKSFLHAQYAVNVYEVIIKVNVFFLNVSFLFHDNMAPKICCAAVTHRHRCDPKGDVVSLGILKEKFFCSALNFALEILDAFQNFCRKQ